MDTKKVVALVVAALIVFYVITQPAQGAAAITSVLGWLGDGMASIVGFVFDFFG